jgi:hypothetical protein
VVSVVYGYYQKYTNNIVVIYEIKSFYVTLAPGKNFRIIYIKQIIILLMVKNGKKTNNTIVLPLGGIVYRKKSRI